VKGTDTSLLKNYEVYLHSHQNGTGTALAPINPDGVGTWTRIIFSIYLISVRGSLINMLSVKKKINLLIFQNIFVTFLLSVPCSIYGNDVVQYDEYPSFIDHVEKFLAPVFNIPPEVFKQLKTDTSFIADSCNCKNKKGENVTFSKNSRYICLGNNSYLLFAQNGLEIFTESIDRKKLYNNMLNIGFNGDNVDCDGRLRFKNITVYIEKMKTYTKPQESFKNIYNNYPDKWSIEPKLLTKNESKY
jgi:hypothetical protein